MGCLLLFFGSIITFFGGKFFSWVLSGIAGTIVFLLFILFTSILGAFKALDHGKEATAGQITVAIMTFLVGLVIALFVGWVIKKIQRPGICILGTVAGFFLGFVLYTFVFA